MSIYVWHTHVVLCVHCINQCKDCSEDFVVIIRKSESEILQMCYRLVLGATDFIPDSRIHSKCVGFCMACDTY